MFQTNNVQYALTQDRSEVTYEISSCDPSAYEKVEQKNAHLEPFLKQGQESGNAGNAAGKAHSQSRAYRGACDMRTYVM